MNSKIIIGILAFVLIILSYFLFYGKSVSDAEQSEAVISEMKSKNKAIMDSLSSIISELKTKDSLIQIKKDSLENRLEILQGLTEKLKIRTDKATEKINQNLVPWDSLSAAQKDSILSAAIKSINK